MKKLMAIISIFLFLGCHIRDTKTKSAFKEKGVFFEEITANT